MVPLFSSWFISLVVIGDKLYSLNVYLFLYRQMALFHCIGHVVHVGLFSWSFVGLVVIADKLDSQNVYLFVNPMPWDLRRTLDINFLYMEIHDIFFFSFHDLIDFFTPPSNSTCQSLLRFSL